MAYTTINKSTDYFNTKLYTGNGTTHAITGVGFQPDMVWAKARAGTVNHGLADVVRGATNQLRPNDTTAEFTGGFVSFNADGFTLNNNHNENNNGVAYVGWNWKAGGGQGSSNTDGSINTTYTSVNTTAGFSISKYTGTGSNATVGHGLGVAPKMIIFKRLDSADDWTIYHTSLGATNKIDLNNTGATSAVASVFNNTAPTNSLMYVGTNGRTNASSGSYIAYAFAEKTGYSKFGSYTGNGNADGTFVYTGFKPAFVIAKQTSGVDDWRMITQNVNSRNTISNSIDKNLYAHGNNAETSTDIDFVSNGMKIRSSSGGINSNGATFLYMAFGQSLVSSNNIPCTAR